MLESVVVTPAGRRRLVRVTVDLPDDQTGSLDLDRIAEVSRAVSNALDDKEPLGQHPYVLEVSSPGVTRPLTEQRHWRRARTRLVAVAVAGDKVTGRLIEVDDEGVVLLIDDAQRRVEWADLGTGHVQVEFSRADDDPDDDEPDGDDLDGDVLEPGDALEHGDDPDDGDEPEDDGDVDSEEQED